MQTNMKQLMITTKRGEIIATFKTVYSIKKLGKRFLIYGFDESIAKPTKINLIALDSVSYDYEKEWKENIYLTSKHVNIQFISKNDFNYFTN
jgi:hypothetical protein